MLKLTTKKSHNKIKSDKLPDGHEVYDYHVQSIFLGHHTIFTLLGLALGADLLARTIYEYLSEMSHPIFIITLGLVLFVGSGLLVGSFND